VLTKAQIIALEKAKTEKEADGEFESKHPGLLRPGCLAPVSRKRKARNGRPD
jgi:hypothetical protein